LIGFETRQLERLFSKLMRYTVSEAQCRNLEVSSRLEWLLPNGIGGYAMGTVSGIETRRYHGHLVAATRPPAERMLLLACIEASIQGEGAPAWISTNQYPGAIFPEGYRYLESFTVDNAAIWTYRIGKIRIQKKLSVHSGTNAATVEYRNLSDAPILLTLRPFVAHRTYHGSFRESPGYPDHLEFPKGKTVVGQNGIHLHLSHPGAQRFPVHGWYFRFEHAREFERGLDGREDLYCPCELRYELLGGETAVLVAAEGKAARPWSAPEAEKDSGSLGSLLREATSKFLVQGGERTSIIAGYPWFTDWGRDTMIALPGVCLATGNHSAAKQILTSYAAQMSDGLIPNRFVEEGQNPEYNTVDATLWFANAAYLTLRAKWDTKFAATIYDVLDSAFRHHVEGTRFGIRVDPDDGLLTQGEPGIQLTWMDAKIDDWVVTPRHGKPVEVNGLWVNFLRVLEWLAEKLKHDGEPYRAAAEQAEKSFSRKFWCASRGHYFDTVDPYDASLRPNQVIAMSLPFGPAMGEHALEALRVVERELLTPVGLRTLGPNEPGYRGRFKGPLRELDAAYHQGTVWPWLLGPYVSALVRLTGDRKEAKNALRHTKDLLSECGLGGISECYDGDLPQSPGGCPFQAWSAAEILRAWTEDVGGD